MVCEHFLFWYFVFCNILFLLKIQRFVFLINSSHNYSTGENFLKLKKMQNYIFLSIFWKNHARANFQESLESVFPNDFASTKTRDFNKSMKKEVTTLDDYTFTVP